MGRQINRLSTKKVQTEKKVGYYPDGNGLYLVVGPTGSKFWSFIYVLNGVQREMGLGHVALVSLGEARTKRDDYRKLLQAKVDPIKARKSDQAKALIAAAKGVTFKQCAETYIEAHEASWHNAKHTQQWKNTLATYAYPVIGKLSVQDIDVGEVRRVLDPIWKKKTETANRLRGRIEKILDWAKVSGYRQGDNPALWRGHLDKLMLHRSKIQKTEHHPALPYNQVGDFVIGLKNFRGIDARTLEFTILTACRTNEVTQATWEEIDFENKIWTIPAARMKMRREHRVPLTGKALLVLQQAAALKNAEEKGKKKANLELKGWIFPGKNRTKAISNMAMLALLKRMERTDITVHGFRSTFRDWAAEETPFSREVAEAALAHAVENRVEAAYRRGDLLDKRRELMNKWATYCYIPSPKENNDKKILKFVPKRQRRT